jgi:phosphoglycolate phosphatase-like HAD superfamily hydrolase
MYTNVIFDFDGVVVDSNEIRTDGFSTIYASEAGEKLEAFMKYVRSNRGLSRYRRIRYYYEHVLQQAVNDEIVRQDAERYSQIVADAVANAPEIPGAEAFLSNHLEHFGFALVSASDQEELRSICQRRGISKYFKAILGSPEEKPSNIANLLRDHGWSRQTTVYVGDSINDLQAAKSCDVPFIGFGRANFPESEPNHPVIDSFKELPAMLFGANKNRNSQMEPNHD